MEKLQWSKEAPQCRGNYIAGHFKAPTDVVAEVTLYSPADLDETAFRYRFGYKDVDVAVDSARTAFERWRLEPLENRVSYLMRYKECLKQVELELAEAISREIGKPLWEALQEVSAMINKVDVSVNDGLALIADKKTPNILPGTEGVWRQRPHGVFVVIGPFNFPGHLANGHIVPALLTGNCVIFKPSEKSPSVGQIMAEALNAAGLPPGVFSMIQGDGEVGRRLTTHEGIDGVLFTGSYDVGLKIKQDTINQYWKLLALEMGGKNSSIVLEDANVESAIFEVLTSAFLTTGQRCSATSRVMVSEKIFDQFTDLFHEKAKRFSIGHPLENPFMGPLIDQSSVDKYLKFQSIASREGCEVVMRGKQLETSHRGYYVTPSIHRATSNDLAAVKKSIYQQTEIFGPNVLLYRVQSKEEAVRLADATQYGLALSVFTSSRTNYEWCFERVRAGVINWNRSTVGASSRLPFGGLKRSGNHFPTAVSASYYCTYPIASLEVAEPKLPAQFPNGMNWK
jgi:succinylglutamic semialdehyde dehydrogenase